MRTFKFSIALSVFFSATTCVQNEPKTQNLIDPKPAATSNQAGTKYIAWQDGIGETGISEDDFGIGGTGIVGTISGFASIIVNGIHIQYSPSQPLESLLPAKTAGSLEIGQVVAVEATYVKGQFVARRIIKQLALVGVVEAVDTAKGEILVQGKRVLVLPNDVGNSIAIENIEIGSQIAISGLRDTQTLYASHISPHQKQAGGFASGTITALEDDRVTIDNNRSFEVADSTKFTLSLGDFIGINTAKLKKRDASSQTTVRRIYGKMFDGKVTRTAVEWFFPSSATKKTKITGNSLKEYQEKCFSAPKRTQIPFTQMVQWILSAKPGEIIGWTSQKVKRDISLLRVRVTRKRRIKSALPKPNAPLLATKGETKMVAVQTAAAKVPANHKFATAFTQRPRIKRL